MKKKKTPQGNQKQKNHWGNKRTIVVTRQVQNNSTTVWYHHYIMVWYGRSFRSYLERCVPSQCRLRSESPAGANPAGIVSDRHTTSADRAAPSPQKVRLIQTHENTITDELRKQDTECDSNREKCNSPVSKHCRTSRPPPAVRFLYRVGLSRPTERRAYGYGNQHQGDGKAAQS